MGNQATFERMIEDDSMNGKFAVFAVNAKIAIFDELETAKEYAKKCAEEHGHVQTLIVKIEAKFQSIRVSGTVGEDNQFTETGRVEMSHGSLATVYFPKFEDGIWKEGWLGGGWGQAWGASRAE
jgi:hypothetical protein